MKIDAHQHFWKYNKEEYAWIGEGMEVLKRDFLPTDLKVELDKYGFDGSVVVQARQTLAETEWLLELASQYPIIKGVVAWVDLCSPNVEQQLALYAQNPKLKGVRHVVHDEPDDNFMLDKDFLNGISLLKRYNLTYDLLLFPKHLPVAAKVVEMFPEQKFVLDHIAKPLIKDGILTPWDEALKKLSAFPNVFCKLSGMVTEADWKLWKLEDFTKYLDVVFSAFGEERVMIGSDWPVCTVAGSYTEVMGVVWDYISGLNKETQEKILGLNCASFYNLGT